MESANFTLVGRDGLELSINSWLPESPHAVIHLNHGMSEHSLRYAHLAEFLAGQGFALYAHDHRGHGQSVDADHPLGHFADEDGWNKLVSDMYIVGQEIRKRHAELPFVLFGHSMGSFAVQQMLYQYPAGIDAAVLSASNGKAKPLAAAGRVVARVERARLGKRNVSQLLQKLSFEEFNKEFQPVRTQSDWLSRDQDEVDKYIADPLSGQDSSVQLWIDFLDGLAKLSNKNNLQKIKRDLPIYLFSGDKDPVGEQSVGIKRLVKAYRKVGLRDLTLKLYEGGRHEMLNEINKNEVMNDLATWLNDKLS